MTGLHGCHDRLQGLRIVGIAGEHLIAKRKAIEGHHQGNQDLLAVGPMVPTVAALGLGIALRETLEIRARHVVEQQVVLQGKQLPEPLAQMLLDGCLVGQ